MVPDGPNGCQQRGRCCAPWCYAFLSPGSEVRHARGPPAGQHADFIANAKLLIFLLGNCNQAAALKADGDFHAPCDHCYSFPQSCRSAHQPRHPRLRRPRWPCRRAQGGPAMPPTAAPASVPVPVSRASITTSRTLSQSPARSARRVLVRACSCPKTGIAQPAEVTIAARAIPVTRVLSWLLSFALPK